MTNRLPVPMPVFRINPFDPPPELGIFREETPIRRLSYPDGHTGWLVTSHELARKVLGDNRFSGRQDLIRAAVSRPGEGGILGETARPGFFMRLDPPEHTRFRRLVAPYFTVRRMGGFKPRTEAFFNHQLDRMQKMGPPADLLPFLEAATTSMLCEFLGIPGDLADSFLRATAVLLDPGSTPEQGAAATQQAAELVLDLVKAKRNDPRSNAPSDDLLGSLAGSNELSDEELTGVLLVNLLGGIDVVPNTLALAMFALLEHPTQMARLRSNPDMIDNAVEELLRYATSLQFGPVRTALEDILIGGEVVRAGESVAISLPAANRDPQRFEDPDRLDLCRSASGHVAFNFGIHQCVAQHFARMELRIGILALLQRFPNLRLAVPSQDIPLRSDMLIYGVRSLQVSW